MNTTKTFKEVFGFEAKKGAFWPIEKSIVLAKLGDLAQAFLTSYDEAILIVSKYEREVAAADVAKAMEDLAAMDISINKRDAAQSEWTAATIMANDAGYCCPDKVEFYREKK